MLHCYPAFLQQQESAMDWDDIRIFLQVARSRGIASAARTLAIDPTTVGRRIARLELNVDATLFEGVGKDRRLTERGQELLSHAETIENAALAATGLLSGRPAGVVRLSVAEGFATWLIAPAVTEFHKAHPEIRLDIITASGFLNPSKREADIAVMLARPRHGRLIASKLADYQLRLYGSREYLALNGAPASLAELRTRPLVNYVPEFNYSPELDYLNELGPDFEAAFRSTSINVQHEIIASGAAIGALPRFMGDRDGRLAPVLEKEAEIRRSFWLVSHADMRQLARIDAVARWLKHDIAPRLV
jgi:DNA-binding transcriptional LysR family regulator